MELLVNYDCLNLKIRQRVIRTVNCSLYKLEVGLLGIISKVITCHTAKTIFSQEKPQISTKKKQNYLEIIFHLFSVKINFFLCFPIKSISTKTSRILPGQIPIRLGAARAKQSPLLGRYSNSPNFQSAGQYRTYEMIKEADRNCERLGF